MKTTTQAERLHDYLIYEGPIEPLTAWKELGIYRLAAAVHILRNEGVGIVSKRIPVTNQFGETCKVAQYTLV